MGPWFIQITVGQKILLHVFFPLSAPMNLVLSADGPYQGKGSAPVLGIEHIQSLCSRSAASERHWKQISHRKSNLTRKELYKWCNCAKHSDHIDRLTGTPLFNLSELLENPDACFAPCSLDQSWAHYLALALVLGNLLSQHRILISCSD